jgi:hypothetical protein
MSIVPEDVIERARNGMTSYSVAEIIANRAAEWAFEQALDKLADEYVDAAATGDPEDAVYNTAVRHCIDAIRALIKGGESDEREGNDNAG